MNGKTPRKEHAALSPAQIEARLVAAGVQPTAQRLAICRYVLGAADHPTAEQVKQWTDRNFPKLSLATVYNTLHALVKAGLLQELRFPHSEKAVYDHNISPHHHFLDEKSGALYDVSADEVEVSPKLKAIFQVEGVQLLLRGKVRG